MAHTEPSLMPAGGFLAQSYARGLCQSVGLIPGLSAPTRCPLCALSRPENLKCQNPRGAERAVLGSLERSWRQELPGPTSNTHSSAQTDPNTLKGMLPHLCHTAFFQLPCSSGSSQAWGPSPQAAQASALTSTSQLSSWLQTSSSPGLAPAERGTPRADT